MKLSTAKRRINKTLDELSQSVVDDWYANFKNGYIKGYEDARQGKSPMYAEAHRVADTPQNERRTDRDGDVWEWRGDAWYCIGQADTPQTDCYDYSKSEMENIKCGNGITTEIPQTDCEDAFTKWQKSVADSYRPQTDCETCKHYKLACELFSEVCKYEPTTQIETQNSNLTFEIADTPQTEREGE